jgi:medium-chain acyl-[acyl-carrier-protein] hydrolase
VHHLPEAEFVDELRRLDGTPEDVLRDAEMRQLMLPLLRADFAIAETYVHVPGPPVDCSVLALGGRDDPLVSEPEITAWRETTTGPFRHVMVPGRHFFPDQARGLVLGTLADDLRQALAEVPP